MINVTVLYKSEKSILVSLPQEDLDGFIVGNPGESSAFVRVTPEKLAELEIGDEVKIPLKNWKIVKSTASDGTEFNWLASA